MNEDTTGMENKREIAETVREACIKAFKQGFQDASMSGLCSEGAMEAAVGSVESLDLNQIISDK